MRNHTKVYLKAHGYSVADTMLCESCGAVAVDIHHVETKGMGGDKSKDAIGNLIALCRDCHAQAHGVESRAYKEAFKAIVKDREDG